MSRRADDIETEPHRLDDVPSAPRARAEARTFASTVANFFRMNSGADASEPLLPEASPLRPVSESAAREQALSSAVLCKHWNAIKADGITASQFIAFLQPLADLDGITVSYTYSDEDGTEQVYHHRRGESGNANPLSRAIQDKKLTKEKAMTFALNEEGRVWIESNFMEMSELK